jgi:hypothetical protein
MWNPAASAVSERFKRQLSLPTMPTVENTVPIQ